MSNASPTHLSITNMEKLQKKREHINLQREELLESFNQQLQSFIDDVLQEPNSDNITENNIKVDRDNGRHSSHDLPSKIFVARESVLTELLELSHFRALYHIFVAVLLMLALSSLVTDLFDGREILRIDLVTWAFGRLPDVVMIWLSMHVAAIVVVYPGFYYWSNHRAVGNQLTTYDFIWASFYMLYLFGMFVRPLVKVFETDMPPASTIIVVSEQIRLIMKSHAFVRENLRKIFMSTPNVNGIVFSKNANATDDDDLRQPCPSFSRYLYFLFAPTLVYRDVYPRTSRIRWSYVVSNFAQVFGCFIYLYYVFARFLWPEFEAFRAEHVTLRSFLVSSFHCMLPGGLILLITFFAILHSWHNAFAEMLSFADRLFYKDWWNSTSFSGYYRTWNMLVHDWLYTYIYCDAYKLFNKNRSAAAATVFLISAVVHEYVITVALRFFYPVLFILFMGAGFALTIFRGRSRKWNVFLWWALFSGMGFLACLYSMEWYARRNCPLQSDNTSFWLEIFPRTFSCGYFLS